jgi:monothiol glutaredoxin
MTENPKFSEIRDLVSRNDVVLFMKGTQTQPMCGFSALAVDVLTRLGVSIKDVNVLADEGIRQGIKEFSDWPTIPQLYIKGEFIGGSDIIKEMAQAGELQQLLEEKNVPMSKAA